MRLTEIKKYFSQVFPVLRKSSALSLEINSAVRPLFALFLADSWFNSLIYITSSEKTRERVKEQVREYARLFDFPATVVDGQLEGEFPGISFQEQIRTNKKWLAVLSVEDLSHSIDRLDFFLENSVNLHRDQKWERDQLLELILKLGYQREDLVWQKGQVAIRGEVIDIFSPQWEKPLRSYWFGNKLEKLRFFNPETQRTIKEVEQALVIPASGDFQKTSVFDALKSRGKAILWDNAWWEKASANQLFPIFCGISPREESASFRLEAKDPPTFWDSLDDFFDYLEESPWEKIVIALPSPKKEGMASLLTEKGISFQSGWEGKLARITLFESHLSQGFLLEEIGFALFTAREIFGFSLNQKKQKGLASPLEQKMTETLTPGDYLVHEEHGVGIFRGFREMTVEGVRRVYLEIEYAASDSLFVPVENIHLLQKYSGVGGASPKVSRLGKDDWSKVKKRAEKSANQVASELVELYAKRNLKKGHAFSPDSAWQKELELSFPFVETYDQKKAAEEVKRDMEAPRPMDRLVCGDVGFGKTEIAIRAAFKAVMDGKQVAVLAPTTLLSEQHYLTFRSRMKRFPVSIAVLNRFKTPREQEKIVEGVKRGTVDIVIGTHRLLQKDIQFRNLGLLIIDEEQRFGVWHKEQLKKVKENIDVLTITATPIPRTLYLSLVGIRDMSVIETPPEGRKPVQMIVAPRSLPEIKRAIQFEVDRGGQVFYVSPRIKYMKRIEEEIRTILPGVPTAIAHGRLSGKELEAVMEAFYQGEIKVLICTTIIEIGLDVPNANTLIVDPATLFGLAQLYQLRGRVGRFDREAYAYFLYPRRLRPQTRERLDALLEFSYSGSGTQLAMRDLEIRGAGNILGKEQHGFVQEIGLSLYSRLLEKEISRLEGKETVESAPPMPSINLKEEAFLPAYYLADDSQRFRYYQRLLLAQNLEEIASIAREMEDLFGRYPQPVENLIQITKLKHYGKIAQVEKIEEEAGYFFLVAPLSLLASWVDYFRLEGIEGILVNFKGESALRIPKIELSRLLFVLERVVKDGERESNSTFSRVG
ncbi:MAG: hypothetical protein PWP04_1543 [Candidatus Atribacteria bacterium]|nr:hypothetical protein [Candidatus Atribacteria bacterium]